MEVCKICGETVSFLTTVHCEKHGITKDDYRLKYGEPVKKKNFTFSKNKEKTCEADLYSMKKMSRSQV